eukprot:TRINITY_DN2204_c0_g1_i1.p1 TRINITY_DN2204_c0_g1~~TRINITY_DN2204_c0_g1_i1.p1  ORF type:complete len:375 (+),score=91.49 TRINITY_DN2204_c0_g1_i1:60-1127(+)
MAKLVIVSIVLLLLVIHEVHSWGGYVPGKKTGCPFGKKSQVSSGEKPFRSVEYTNDPLLNVNNYFLNTYDNTLNELVSFTQNTSIIMLVVNDTLITYLEGQRTVDGPLTPDIYTSLKSVAHVAFATFTILDPVAQINDGALDAKTTEIITQYLDLVYEAYPTLPQKFDNATVLERQYQIVNTSIEFLNTVLHTKNASYPLLVEFARSLTPLIQLNIFEAASAQLDVLHSYVMAKQQEIDEETWNKLIVVIAAGHMPRTQLEFLQYFARLLNTPQTAELRVIYAESLQTEEEMLSLLGDHIDGWQTGIAFFNNLTRMHSDLLSMATEVYLPTILPTSPCCYPSDLQQKKDEDEDDK